MLNNKIILPEGWKIVTFGEIAKHVSERVNPKPGDEVQYIGLEHLDSGSLSVKRWGSEVPLKGQKIRMLKGDILFAKRNAYLKRVAISPFDGIFSAHGMIIRPKGNLIIHDFLPVFMQTDQFMSRAIAISEGSLSPTIKWKTLERQKFFIPPIDQQQATLELVNILTKVEEAKFHALLASKRLLNILLKNITNGSIEFKNYKTGIVGDFLTLQRGFDITKKNASDGNIPVWSSSGFSYYHDEAMLYGKSVITGRKGKLGDVYFVEEPCWPHDTTLFVKNFKGNDPKYIYWFLKSLNLERLDAATAVPTLNRNSVHSLKCKFPDSESQIEFAQVLDVVDATTQHIEDSYVLFKATKMAIINERLSIIDALE
ncbi:restriction endonuclease subunit S [Methylomonas sp. MgM2]